MGDIQTQCPTCHAQFVVPGEFLNRKARCKRCGQDFVIEVPNLEDTVAGWLGEEFAEKPETTASSPSSQPTGPAAASTTPPPPPSAPTPPAPKPPAITRLTRLSDETLGLAPEPRDCLTLSHIDELGAFFLFPPSLLRNRLFRSSVPRCCLGCGDTRDLYTHLVRWQSVSNDRPQAKHEELDLGIVVKTDNLLSLSDDDLLDSLPPVPNTPPPFDQPIPYFICNRCSPVGAIMTHVRPTPDGDETCELGISSLKRAAQFLARNVGRDHEDYRRLAEEIKNGRADPWNTLPLAVRNRLVKWFTIDDDETFIHYIRDADFAKTEGGQAGLVITNKRMVYHKFASHRVIPMTASIELKVDSSDKGYKLTLTAPNVRPAVLNCDPTVTEMIRFTLHELKAKYRFTT